MGWEKRQQQFRKFLKLSVMEGIFGQIFNSLCGPGSAFLTKFAIMLNATPLQFGILSAIGQISQIFQPLGALVTKRRLKRKGVVLALQGGGRGIVMLYGVLPFVVLSGKPIDVFLFLFLISVSLLAVAENAWIGWISDLVPPRFRGRFFSIRSQYLMLTAIGASYVLSLFIDSFTGGSGQALRSPKSAFFQTDHLPLGFAIIFFAAAIAGFVGLGVLSRQPEKIKEIEDESIARIFVIPLKDSNFRRFLLYSCWWMSAVGIGAPFWQPFMMQKLSMSLFEVQIYGSINIIAAILVVRLWGRLIDTYGNRTAMRFIILLGGLNPMVWLFVTPTNYPILYLEAITSGIMWAGAGLVATNFVLSIAPNKRRQLYAGMSGAFSGVAMMTTMLLSGAFLPRIIEISGLRLEPEQVLFALTGLARLSAQVPLSWVLEPRSRPVSEAITSFIREIRPRIMK
jgi:MFS family permease